MQFALDPGRLGNERPFRANLRTLRLYSLRSQEHQRARFSTAAITADAHRLFVPLMNAVTGAGSRDSSAGAINGKTKWVNSVMPSAMGILSLASDCECEKIVSKRSFGLAFNSLMK